MIVLHRRRIRLPQALLEEADDATRRITSGFKAKRRQTRLEFDRRLWHEFSSFLVDLSFGKCAYCETPLSERRQVDHFRPIRSVRDAPSHPGYYWLAYEWTNLLPACQQCMQNKGDAFPIGKEEQRAYTPQHELKGERPLLLNPCTAWFALPRSFIFDAGSGRAVARSIRGDATISVLGLNRSELVKARQEVAIRFDEFLRRNFPARATKSPELIRSASREFTSSRVPFAAIARQMLEVFLEHTVYRGSRRMAPPGIPELARELSPKVAVRIPLVPSGVGYISRVEVSNFRCVRSLKLQVGYGGEERVGWQMLLGENGAGKTSVLQAIALALAGNQHLNEVAPRAGNLLSYGKATRGYVRIWLSKDDVPIRLNFTASGPRFAPGHDGTKGFLRAYGAIRIGPSPDPARAQAPQERRSIRNLFDPHQPIVDTNTWLAGLGAADFDRVAMTLKDVVRFGSQGYLVLERRDGLVKVMRGADVLGSLQSLSRGQQAVLDLAVDIMAGIMWEREESGTPGAPSDFRSSPGIVLLDEIDAHLHPRWKMEIVTSLRRAFPQIQFITTTHEPLCLRGLDDGEIVIMREEGGEATAETSSISPKGLRVDQLLTSPLFGLQSTIDPGLEKDFRRYYELLAREPATLSSDEQGDLIGLAELARTQNRLGYTRRDQLLYEVIDLELAREGPNPTAAVRDRTKARVAKLWEEVTRTRLR